MESLKIEILELRIPILDDLTVFSGEPVHFVHVSLTITQGSGKAQVGYMRRNQGPIGASVLNLN